MITNERQYKITQARVRALKHTASEFIDSIDLNDILQVAQRDGLVSQIDELTQEMAEYEALRSGTREIITVDALEDLPRALIQARIASGFTQRDLADRIGIKEQQIQRYEATLYRSASVERLLEVSHALGVDISNSVVLDSSTGALESLLERLGSIGLSREFLFSRILPDCIGRDVSVSGMPQAGTMSALVRRLEKIFNWNSDILLSGEPLCLSQRALHGVAFKAPKNADEKKLAAYTVYAHYLALVLLDAIQETPRPLPDDPQLLKNDVCARYGEFTLASVLRYAWDHGIVVLPLQDPGAFHGACWRVGEKSVIVLKQSTQSAARWLFDLLHELRHTRQHLDQNCHGVVESEQDVVNSREVDEIEANAFAGNVVLDGLAETLVDQCVEKANGNVRFLKKSVREVASSTGVDTAQLANYLAFRLSCQGINWWGTANNLQDISDNPWLVAREVFLERLDFSCLGSFDRELVTRALDATGGKC